MANATAPSTLLRLPFFLALFFVVRGLPVLVLYRRDVGRRDILPLALLASTALPLVVAITEIGLQTDRMKPEITCVTSRLGARRSSTFNATQVGGVLPWCRR